MSDEPGEEAQRGFDAVSHLQASHRQRRSAALFLRSLRSALRLSRQASPRLAALNLAVQLAAVLFLGLQILFAKLALEAVLDQAGNGGSITKVLPSLLGLVAATGLAGLGTSAQSQLQRLLSEHVQREVTSSILGVTTTVPLETLRARTSTTTCKGFRRTRACSPATWPGRSCRWSAGGSA